MKNTKLKVGDKICVIAPSRSMSLISNEVKQIALSHFEKLGLKVVFGKNIYETDENASSSVSSRIEDLHAAFSDTTIKAIFTVIGGYNSNQLLNKIDYKLIKKNPKLLCGFSDITALSNSIYEKTGIITYYGPHFSSLGMVKGIEYTLEYIKKCFFSPESYFLKPTESWSDDEWYLDQENRGFFPNNGYQVINPGSITGRLIGGNLCTLNLLQGTDYFPSLKNAVIMIEEDNLLGENSLVEFDRNLQSLINCKGFSKAKGILIGRFQVGSKITKEQLYKLIKSKPELLHKTVIANIDFGHTTPIVTLPIGGIVEIKTENDKVSIEILSH